MIVVTLEIEPETVGDRAAVYARTLTPELESHPLTPLGWLVILGVSAGMWWGGWWMLTRMAAFF